MLRIDNHRKGEENAENEVRKDFTQSERVAIAKAVELELGERRGGDQKSNRKILRNDPNEGKETTEIAAKKSGFGNKETYRQAKKVVETGTPELINALDENRIKPSVAASLSELPPADQILLASVGKEKEARQSMFISGLIKNPYLLFCTFFIKAYESPVAIFGTCYCVCSWWRG